MYDPSRDKAEASATSPIHVVNAQPVGFHSGTYASSAPQGDFPGVTVNLDGVIVVVAYSMKHFCRADYRRTVCVRCSQCSSRGSERCQYR